jgi:hypothetical protein
MRRTLPLLFGLALIAAPAAAANSTTSAGTIAALTANRIAIRGAHPLSCRIGAASPVGVQGFAVGNRVVITCEQGVLTGIQDPAAGAETIISSATAHSSPTGPVSESVLSGQNVHIAAVTASSITVAAGSVRAVCKLGPASPDIRAYRAGDRALRLECKNGTLTSITRAS